MIIEIPMFTVECDRCKKLYSTDEYAGWNDINYAWECASDAEWEDVDDKHYCPNCFDRDDDGEIIVKPINALSK